jgi:hypothetical protein
MGVEEANKIIAEYMGLDYPTRNDAGFFMPNPNFKSLDALIPVWEKLDVELSRLIFNGNVQDNTDNKKFHVSLFKESIFAFSDSFGDTIQEAAAIATAKAIQELKNDN